MAVKMILSGELAGAEERARFRREAETVTLRADPKLATEYRSKAARAAALAADGRGEDASGLDDAERTRLRRQALDWLRVRLDGLTRVLKQDSRKYRLTVQRSLAEWQQTPDLAGVRDAGELARLPEAQQRAWRQLWEDVARLLRSVDTPEAKGENQPGPKR